MDKKVNKNTSKKGTTANKKSTTKTTSVKKKTTTKKSATPKKVETPVVVKKEKKKHGGIKLFFFLLLVGALGFGYYYVFGEKKINVDAIYMGEVSLVEHATANRQFEDNLVLDKYYEYRTFISYLSVENKLSKEDFDKKSYVIGFVDDGYCNGKIKNVTLRSVFDEAANMDIKMSGDCKQCKGEIYLYLLPIDKEDSSFIKKVNKNYINTSKKCK